MPREKACNFTGPDVLIHAAWPYNGTNTTLCEYMNSDYRFSSESLRATSTPVNCVRCIAAEVDV
jgi:hypothetical protein